MASAALAAFRAVAAGGAAHTGTRAALMACPPLSVRLVHAGRDSGVVGMGTGSHMSNNDPDVIQKEKERNLTGKTPEFVPGVPGWNEKLASDSEAAVKAERSDASIQEMVEHTTKVVQEEYVEESAPSRTKRSPIDPSEAPAIKEHLKYDKEQHERHTKTSA